MSPMQSFEAFVMFCVAHSPSLPKGAEVRRHKTPGQHTLVAFEITWGGRVFVGGYDSYQANEGYHNPDGSFGGHRSPDKPAAQMAQEIDRFVEATLRDFGKARFEELSGVRAPAERACVGRAPCNGAGSALG